jgi:hypothetical protein
MENTNMKNDNINWEEVKKQLKKILKKNAQRRKPQGTSSQVGGNPPAGI